MGGIASNVPLSGWRYFDPPPEAGCVSMSEEELRESEVRQAFDLLCEEFLRRIDPMDSGNLTIHYQNGLPTTRKYDFGGRIQQIPLTVDNEQ